MVDVEDGQGDVLDDGAGDGTDDLEPLDGSYPPDAGPGSNVPIPRASTVRNAARGHLAPKVVRKTKQGPIPRGGKRLMVQQKRRQAIEMRKAGATYVQIAAGLGYHDASAAYKAVQKGFGEIVQEPVAELKALQKERLNHMLVAIWQKVQTGDERAIMTALSIMNKMDALDGTEAAQRVEVNSVGQQAVLVVDGNKDDYISALKKMSGAGIQPDGSNAGSQSVQQQQTGPVALPSRYPPGMAPVSDPTPAQEAEEMQGEQVRDIVDAVLVGEVRDTPQDMSGAGQVRRDVKMSDCLAELGTACMEDGCPVHHPNPPVVSQKKFGWGMDPKVRPRPRDQR